jgi:hypothetical protein
VIDGITGADLRRARESKGWGIDKLAGPIRDTRAKSNAASTAARSPASWSKPTYTHYEYLLKQSTPHSASTSPRARSTSRPQAGTRPRIEALSACGLAGGAQAARILRRDVQLARLDNGLSCPPHSQAPTVTPTDHTCRSATADEDR